MPLFMQACKHTLKEYKTHTGKKLSTSGNCLSPGKRKVIRGGGCQKCTTLCLLEQKLSEINIEMLTFLIRGTSDHEFLYYSFLYLPYT